MKPPQRDRGSIHERQHLLVPHIHNFHKSSLEWCPWRAGRPSSPLDKKKERKFSYQNPPNNNHLIRCIRHEYIINIAFYRTSSLEDKRNKVNMLSVNMSVNMLSVNMSLTSIQQICNAVE